MRCERTRFVLKFLYSISKDEEKLAMILRKTIVKNILIDIIWTVKPLPPSHKLRLEHEEGLRDEKLELPGATTNMKVIELRTLIMDYINDLIQTLNWHCVISQQLDCSRDWFDIAV